MDEKQKLKLINQILGDFWDMFTDNERKEVAEGVMMAISTIIDYNAEE